MGGRPLYALLSLCMAGWAGEKWKNQFLAGLFGLAERWGVALIGGDLAGGERLAADIVVLGSAAGGRILRRSAAKTGDILYVSGHLGGSALGLERLRTGRPVRDRAVRRHLYPTPRVALGQYLAGEARVRAAMDLSDGLSIDLYRLAKESGVGAEVRWEDLPVFQGATREQALHGGEEYELLFTAAPGKKVPGEFEGVPLTAIGQITAGRRLVLVREGRRRAMPIEGFEHNV